MMQTTPLAVGYVHKYIHTDIYTYTYVHVHVHVHVYMYMYICICVYIHSSTHFEKLQFLLIQSRRLCPEAEGIWQVPRGSSKPRAFGGPRLWEHPFLRVTRIADPHLFGALGAWRKAPASPASLHPHSTWGFWCPEKKLQPRYRQSRFTWGLRCPETGHSISSIMAFTNRKGLGLRVPAARPSSSTASLH